MQEIYRKLFWVLIILIIISVAFILLGQGVKNRLSLARSLIDSCKITYDSVLSKIRLSLTNDNAYNDSYVLSVFPGKGIKLPFSNLILQNNKDKKQLYARINNYRAPSGELFNISLAGDSDELAINLNDDPRLSYSAKAKRFKARWNKSIYSYLYSIPEFVPDDVDYNSLLRTAGDDTFLKAVYVFLFGNNSLNIGELAGNTRIVKISKPQYDRKNTKEHYKLYISKSYLIYLMDFDIDMSAELVEIKDSLLKLISNHAGDDIELDFTITNGIIESCTSKIGTKNKYYILLITLDENSIVLNINYFKDSREIKNISLTAQFGDGLELKLLKNKNILLSAKLDKVRYSNYYVMGGKDIYTLSLLDLYELYKGFSN